MIISCSRRSDIPAVYSAWLMRHLKLGYCDVPNPMNPHQISRVSLRPEDVTLIVFWTKNPAPLIEYLAEIDRLGYRYYFLFTLNGYDRQIEPNVPELAERICTFRRLSELIGPEKMVWRYDPILISSNTDAAFHIEKFSFIAQQLRGFVHRVVVSLVDFYKKRKKDFHDLELKGYRIEQDPGRTMILDALFPSLVDAAKQSSMEIQSCAEPIDLGRYGVLPGKCIDDGFIKRVFGIHVSAAKDNVQRPFCGCVKSRDIGQYNTCSLGCRYCYANA